MVFAGIGRDAWVMEMPGKTQSRSRKKRQDALESLKLSYRGIIFMGTFHRDGRKSSGFGVAFMWAALIYNRFNH